MQRNRRLFLAALLTWIAGFVDAVGFISLGHIYTANMSGNTVAIGIQAVSQNWPETLRRATPVLAYFIGLLFCRLLIEVGARKRIRSIATVALVFEIALLIPVCAIPGLWADRAIEVSLAYVALLALAMGIQNGALTHFSSLTVHTGFVTGTLVKCAERTAKYLTWIFDEICQRDQPLIAVIRRSGKEKQFQLSAWLLMIWLAYVAGAVCGSFGDYTFSFRSLIVPIAVLLGIVVIDLKYPLALKEEQEQSNLLI
jgi:uncharacterized membrane protein YoaK (UPF0700 family)